MPKRVPTFVERLGKEVFELFEEKQEFSLPAYKSAFAHVAHRHSIWHHKDRAEYNRFFEWVMKEVKLLIKKHNQLLMKHEMIRVLPRRAGPRKQVRVPVLDPWKLRYNLSLF